MREELETVVDELKRLKAEGVSHLYVSEESLQALRRLAKEGQPAPAGTAPQPARQPKARSIEQEVREAIPENIRSASAEDFQQLLKQQPAPKAPVAGRATANKTLPPPPKVDLPEGDKRSRWEALRETVLSCPVCNAHKRDGYKVVFGVGSIDADIFFCGEAPGAEEEEQGEPFVGKAGQLLTKMIQAMGLQREQVYIGNIMNWRPEMPTRTGNRPPTEEEINFCLPYLKAQVEVVQPKVIVALGVTAAKGLLGFQAFRSLRQIKGQWQEFEGTPVLPTYHPSYLLRNSSNRDKRDAWEDLLKVMERAGLPISEKQARFFL